MNEKKETVIKITWAKLIFMFVFAAVFTWYFNIYRDSQLRLYKEIARNTVESSNHAASTWQSQKEAVFLIGVEMGSTAALQILKDDMNNGTQNLNPANIVEASKYLLSQRVR